MPILTKPAIMVTAGIYLFVVLAIGIWSARRTRTARDFWIAGQNIGVFVTGLATTSAAFSGFVFVGGPGLMYSIGIRALFLAIPVSFAPALLCWVVAKRLRLLSEVRDVYTIPDAIRCRFRSRAASGTAAVAVLVGAVAYLGAQFLALGRILEAIFGTREIFSESSLLVAMTLGVIVVVFYSIAGGMVAGVYTDLFQGSMMVVVAAVVFAYALAVGGGLTEIARSISQSEAGPSFLDPYGTGPVLAALSLYFVFMLGNLGQPQMLHKFYMLDDPMKLKWLPVIIGITQCLCVLIMLGVGLAVPALVARGELPPLSNPDDAAPLFLLHFAPEILAGLVFAGILAAIMSSVDSFLNIGAAALVRDVPRALGHEVRNELLWGRLATIVTAAVAFVLAYLHGDLIALLGTLAYGTFGASFAPVMAVGLNWKRVTASAATAAMSTGVGLNVGLELLARQGVSPFAPGVLPTAVSMAASFTVLFVVTFLTPEETIDDDVAAVMEV